MRIAKELKSELNGAELTFVGHSLGGGLSTAAAYATGGCAITFNPAGATPFYYISSEFTHPTLASGTPVFWIMSLSTGYVYSLKLYLKRASYMSLWPSVLSWAALMGYFYFWDFFLKI